jgi:hypothetical protein
MDRVFRSQDIHAAYTLNRAIVAVASCAKKYGSKRKKGRKFKENAQHSGSVGPRWTDWLGNDGISVFSISSSIGWLFSSPRIKQVFSLYLSRVDGVCWCGWYSCLFGCV